MCQQSGREASYSPAQPCIPPRRTTRKGMRHSFEKAISELTSDTVRQGFDARALTLPDRFISLHLHRMEIDRREHAERREIAQEPILFSLIARCEMLHLFCLCRFAEGAFSGIRRRCRGF